MHGSWRSMSFLARETCVTAKEGTRPSPDPHGQVALMLCESLLHVLVEERILTKEKALDAIETVAELTREMAETGKNAATSARWQRDQARAAMALIESIGASFAAKSPR